MPELFPYQATGVEWLIPRRRSFLFDHMGLGKTPQFIRAASGAGARSLLVLCPAIARAKWAREIKTWSLAPHKVHVVEGTRDPPPAAATACVINYDVLKHYLSSIGDRRWDAAAIDEGHVLKNEDAIRTRCAYGREGILRGAGSLTLMTGTPARNHPGELWTHLVTFYQADMRREGIPTTKTGFLDRYCDWWLDAYGEVRVRSGKNLDELKAFLTPRMLCRKEGDVPLPALLVEETPLPAANLDLKSYVGAEGGKAIASMVRQGMSDEEAFQMYLSDRFSTFRRLSGLAKVEPVAELIDTDFDSGMDKVIIFAHHRDVISGLETRLAQHGVTGVWGGMTTAAKERAMHVFNNDARYGVFLGQIDACGTAIDLVAAREVVFCEMSVVPGDNSQALKRAHRIGQKRSVRVRLPYLAGTVDEAMVPILRRKLAMINPLFT